MFKKSIMMLVVVAIVATFTMIPAAAAVEDSIFFDVDFDTQDVVDSTGNFAYEDLDSAVNAADLTYEWDDEIGRNVLVLEGDGMLTWHHVDGEAGTLFDHDLNIGVTVEAFFNITTDPETEKMNMVIIETNDAALHLQEYNSVNEDGTVADLSAGYRAGDGSGPQLVSAANAYIEGTFPHMEWVHVVGTSDAAENRLYINGVHRATYTRSDSTLKNSYGSKGSNVYIGESYLTDMFGPTKFTGKIAFARIYKQTATVDDIAALYEAATGNEAPVNDGPTPAPVTAPPTAVPTAAPTEENAGTFDLGLVSLAAVALSSVVAIKKRK